jgi:prolyl-tRNA synthetase
MVMTHSDDKGLVLPPHVAPLQVVVVPITKGPQSGAEHDAVVAKAQEMVAALKAVNVRAKLDTRYEMRPGMKYFEWERKGLPLRVDIGARDLQKSAAVMAVRHTGSKMDVDISSAGGFAQTVRAQLDKMHEELLAAARQRLVSRTVRVDSYEEMRAMLTKHDHRGEENASDQVRAAFFLAPWKCDAANEAAIKEDCKATIRCYPFASNVHAPAPGVKCFYSGDQATHMALFARAF